MKQEYKYLVLWAVLFIVTYNIYIFYLLMLLFMNRCNDFAPCGPSIGQYYSYSYSYILCFKFNYIYI
jgi:hypothetical protein